MAMPLLVTEETTDVGEQAEDNSLAQADDEGDVDETAETSDIVDAGEASPLIGELKSDDDSEPDGESEPAGESELAGESEPEEVSVADVADLVPSDAGDAATDGDAADAPASDASPATGADPAAETVSVITLDTEPAADTEAADSPASDTAEVAGPDADDGSAKELDLTREVTVVPGVPRYHNAQCILIRFMGDGDLERMPLGAAQEAGCTPCRACLPNSPVGSNCCLARLRVLRRCRSGDRQSRAP